MSSLRLYLTFALNSVSACSSFTPSRLGLTSAAKLSLRISAGIIQACQPRLGEPVQVASIQTLHARAYLPTPSSCRERTSHCRLGASSSRGTYETIIGEYPKAIVIV